jgi:hypothetical protein
MALGRLGREIPEWGELLDEASRGLPPRPEEDERH